MLLLIINIFYIPLKFSFEDKGTLHLNQFMKIFLDTIPAIYFVIDIVLNFNTAFYCDGLLIKSRKKISKNYIKTQFFWDVIVICPFVLNIYLNVPYLDAILIFRTKKMMQLIRTMQNLISISQQVQAILELCKLVFFILFVAHFMGCAYYYIHLVETASGMN